MQPRPILIMAGGTGGHVYPALAVADYLRKQRVPVLWLGTASGLEAKVVPKSGYRLLTIKVSGLRGRGLRGWLRAPLMLCSAMWQALKIMYVQAPAAVLGMGGYAAGPGGLAAWLLGIPLYLHEQNAVAGLTNRMLAPFARQIMQGFPDTFAPRAKLSTTGNPVRAALVCMAAARQRKAADGKEELREAAIYREELRLLVLGGSQGARRLNQVLPVALRRLPKEVSIAVRHQTGENNLDATRRLYRQAGLMKDDFARVRLEGFVEDMAAAYHWANLLLCRAGALTIAELCVVGLAAILVPFPHAADDHQTANARYLSEREAAILLPEPQLEERQLAALLEGLFKSGERLDELAANSRALAYPDAARAVAAHLEVARV